MGRTTKAVLWTTFGLGAVLTTAVVVLLAYHGSYGLHVLARRGGTYWLSVGADSPRLSSSMRLALLEEPRGAAARFEWHAIGQGFEVADLPVIADDRTVDHILLARIDPGRFRFVVRTSAAGDKGLDEWMEQLGAVLVVNGSYYGHYGQPDTPLVSDGVLLGPEDYEAKAGAFVASASFVGIRSLSQDDWRRAFQGAENAMVSYPLLVSEGTNRVGNKSRWLANRSFVAQDGNGRIVIGTTTDAFFSLHRLAAFLLDAPLDLKIALNLDGGPVASQGVALDGYERKTYGRWETQVEGDKVRLLAWPYGSYAMPIVLAVFAR